MLATSQIYRPDFQFTHDQNSVKSFALYTVKLITSLFLHIA